MTILTILTPLTGSGATEQSDVVRDEAEERRRKVVTSSLKEDGDAEIDGKKVKVVKMVKISASPPHGDGPSSSLAEPSGAASFPTRPRMAL
jgi:hypothetical protein